MSIGKEIRKAAIDRGMTLGVVADGAGMKRTRFSQCLNGHKEFTADEIASIGTVLSIPGWELMRRADRQQLKAIA